MSKIIDVEVEATPAPQAPGFWSPRTKEAAKDFAIGGSAIAVAVAAPAVATAVANKFGMAQVAAPWYKPWGSPTVVPKAGLVAAAARAPAAAMTSAPRITSWTRNILGAFGVYKIYSGISGLIYTNADGSPKQL